MAKHLATSIITKPPHTTMPPHTIIIKRRIITT